MKANEILRTGVETIESRGKERDQPDGERSMKRTVKAFNAFTGLQLTEIQGWQFMICLKQARANGGGFTLDDWQDMACYAALAGECGSESGKVRVSGVPYFVSIEE